MKAYNNLRFVFSMVLAATGKEKGDNLHNCHVCPFREFRTHFLVQIHTKILVSNHRNTLCLFSTSADGLDQ